MKTSLFSRMLPSGNQPPFTFKRKAALLALGMLLLLIIVTYTPQHSADAQGHKPFDLISDFQDLNGFNFNPRWAWQVDNAGRPDPNALCFNSAGEFEGCTSDSVYFDEPEPWKILRQTCKLTAGTAIAGHINWRAVAYEARIAWSEFSIDGDYCFELAPANNNGLTANRETLHVEFSASETIKQFETSWWKEFRKSVGIRGLGAGTKEREFVDKFINGKRAVVIGLLNLDCVHKCYTELHPVYAIAINTSTEKRSDGTVDDVWAILARNWGNEGWCSQNQHNLDLENNANQLFLTLPWGPDIHAGNTALSFEVVNTGTRFLSSHQQATGPELSIAGNQGIKARFVLPPAEQKARIHGELRLRWTVPSAMPGQPSTSVSFSSTMSVPLAPPEEREEKLLFEALGEEGRKRVVDESKAGKADSVPQKVTVKRETGISRVFSIFDKLTNVQKVIIQPAPPPQPPRIKSVFDAQKSERDRHLLGIPPNSPP